MTKMLIVASLCSLLALPAAAADHRIAGAAGAGVWPHPESGFHALYKLAYDVEGLWDTAHFGAEINTDTLRLSIDRVPLVPDLLEAGVRVSGEVRFAGLLVDYYRDGKRDPARGFEASFVHVEAHLKASLPANNYLEAAVGLRRWFFDSMSSTDPAFVLPDASWVVEPRLRYTYWDLGHDLAWRDRHRLFPRVRGLAFGMELGLDWRSNTSAWGAIDLVAFGVPDLRNDPDAIILSLRQWLRFGWQLHDRVRTQVFQSLAVGRGEDDLTRARLGGLNPYVVPIAGIPWAGYVSGQFLAAENSWHFRLLERLEAGFMINAALIEDADRYGQNDAYQAEVGVGLFVDYRFWDFQLDVRAGWSPTHDEVDPSGAVALFAAFGWQWD